MQASKRCRPQRTGVVAATGARARRLSVLLACAGVALGYGHAAQVADSNNSPQGRNWDSIKKLPDWRGVWALTIEGHLHANAEGFDNSKTGLAVPLTPKYFKLRHDSQQVSDPSKLKETQETLAYCLPAGVPGIMLHTIQYEFLFTPGRVTMLTENGEVRRFYTDGRPHLSRDELSQSYEGDSIGHWEGETLVVDTIGFSKGMIFQNGNVTATKNTHYVERIHLKDKDHLQIDSSMDDPAIFTAPFNATRIYERLGPSFPMSEPQCSQTNRDTGESIDLTPPEE